jgi:type IV secretion system protein VirB3
MAPRPQPIASSLWRPHLLMGGERVAVGVVVGACLMVISVGWQVWSMVCMAIGLLCLPIALYVLRRMAKADPQMIGVYLRSLRFPRYMRAHSTPFYRK